MANHANIILLKPIEKPPAKRLGIHITKQMKIIIGAIIIGTF